MHWIIDPGHGWLEVSLADYPDAINHGTGFGYYAKATCRVYLEEDCEAPSFLRSHPEIDWQAIPCFTINHSWSGRDTLDRVPNYARESA
jgi:hypothetical protein